MYKAFANTTIFTITYLILVLPTYYLAHTGVLGNGLGSHVLTLPFMLYALSMVAIWSLCLVRGAIIGKHWLVLIPTVAFVFNLTPALNAVPFVPYVYHLLAIILGVACPLVAVSVLDTTHEDKINANQHLSTD